MLLSTLLLGIIACCITFIPMCYVLARLICVYNAQTQEKRVQIHGQVLVVGLAAAMLVALYLFVHKDIYTGLDVACYRQLAASFAEDGRGFHDVDVVYESIPKNIKADFLYRPKGRLTRDLIFQLKDDSCSTEPFFLPMLSLGAAALPDKDLFVPICGALWFASLLAFGLCKGGVRGLFFAAGCFFATFWPMWFLRGFHTDVIGAILVGTSLLIALIPQLRERKLDVFVIGFLLGCSVGYHFTMVVPAGIVAVYLLLTKGWNIYRLGWLIFGGAIGLIPMLYQLAFICTPYGNILSVSAFVEMFVKVKEIQFLSLALLFAIIVFVSFAAVILNKNIQPKIHAFLDKYASKINPILICASAFLWVFYAIFAGPITAGLSTIQTGVVYALPLVVFSTVLLVVSKENGSVIYSALVLLLSLMATLFVYLKGVEVHVGLWSQRRFFPVVAMFIPCLIVALSSLKSKGIVKYLPFVFVLVSFIPIIRWPVAYFGIADASQNEENGRASVTTEMDAFIEKYNDQGKAIFIFDYFPHSVPFQHDLNRCVLGVGELAQWNYPRIIKWAFEKSKENASDAFFISSYGTPKLEDGVAMMPICTFSDNLDKFSTKGVFPVEKNAAKGEIKNVVCLMQEPTRSSSQYVSLVGNLYPFGLRQPWGKTTRHGTWSRQGSGIVGPIPEKGGKVTFTISAMWTPPVSDGSWDNQELIIRSPFGVETKLSISATNKDGLYSCEIERAEEDDFGDSVTGVYQFFVEKPYSPLEYGTKGFDSDLGVVFKHISIKCSE